MENHFFYKKAKNVTVLSASISDFKYKTHAHEEYALGVTLRGIQQYNLKGSFLSSHKNGVMLFNPDQAHDGMSFDKSGIDYVMLYIKPSYFRNLLRTKEMPFFSSPLIYDFRLRKRILDISSSILYQKNDFVCEESISTLAEYFNPSLLENHKQDQSLIRKAKRLIRSNIKSIKLEELCKELNISKYKFIRMFKFSTGITPYQYYLSVKIETAKQIIENTKDIYSAVEECNYVDLTHLNKHFKSIYGITAFNYLNLICK